MTILLPRPADVPAARTVAREPSLGDVPQVRCGLVQLVVLGAVTAAHVVHAAALDAVVLVAVLTVLSAAVLPTRYVVVTAVIGWAWLTGFVVNADGVLTLHPADLGRLLALAVIGLGAGLVRAGAAPGR